MLVEVNDLLFQQQRIAFNVEILRAQLFPGRLICVVFLSEIVVAGRVAVAGQFEAVFAFVVGDFVHCFVQGVDADVLCGVVRSPFVEVDHFLSSS